MQISETKLGNSSLILAFPHTGTWLPDAVTACLNVNGKTLADTDWHIHRLYDGLVEDDDLVEDVTTVRALFHRYVIDANRDPGGRSLYPGQNTTGLVPLTDFDGLAIWRDSPVVNDIADRLASFYRPYHVALQAEIDRIKVLHGYAIVFDCHSIRSQIPYLFEGKLPDFNIGTDGGRTCDAAIERAAVTIASQATGYTHVLNGRFKGGWTTRHYGQPLQNVHAIQLELSQSTYLVSEALPFTCDTAKADQLRVHLKTMLETIIRSLSGSVR
jgi:N-formylglutamate deformylase